MSIKDLQEYGVLQKEIGVLEERMGACLLKIARIEEFLGGIERADIRMIIDYRYFKGLSWVAVSQKVYGEPSENRARMALVRFLRKGNAG